MTKDVWGRPTAVTPEILQKLETGFSYSFTDEEACLYAGISVRTLYYYIEKNPTFLHRKEILKRTPSLMAKENIVNELKKKNVNQSNWWLERKNKTEFSTRQETTGADGWPIEVIDPEAQKAVDRLMTLRNKKK